MENAYANYYTFVMSFQGHIMKYPTTLSTIYHVEWRIMVMRRTWQMSTNQDTRCNSNKNASRHGMIMMHHISTSKFDKVANCTIFTSMSNHEDNTLIFFVLDKCIIQLDQKPTIIELIYQHQKFNFVCLQG
jgi:hypothetical protein